MKKSKSSAIRIIVIMGVVVFALLMLAANGLRKAVQSGQGERTVVATPASSFNAPRAFDDLKRIVAIGPRVSGSEAIKQLQQLIADELTKAGLEVRRQEFDASTPNGVVHMVNLVGVVQGTRPGIIVLGNHYDTKHLPKFTFVGANDGGSTTAWMLEMARTLGPKRNGKTVWLTFFDGEESVKTWSATDSLYGSREFVDKLRADGQLSEVHAMINVDMIGDSYLGIRKDPNAPQWLTHLVWETAQALGYGQYFQPFSLLVEDDHLPFRHAGVNALNLIDFSYGKSVLDHSRNWHTANDTLERVCPDSLQVVGDVIYHVLPKLDAMN